VIVPANFGELSTCFGPSIVEISNGRRLENALDSVSGQHGLNRRLGSRSSDQPVPTRFG